MHFDSNDEESSYIEQRIFNNSNELFEHMQPSFLEELKDAHGANDIEVFGVTFIAEEKGIESVITMYDTSSQFRVSTELDVSDLDSEYKQTLQNIKSIVDKKL
ncbi:hypothetical protein P4T89_12575 [Bacillus nakamurai]|uniref:Uncharacterized protein n=1 Tax=Bacillus nakamurai TaxID=1793963 RepID=A0A150FB11_9BACI|nr:hypothetical protein [Bacillus nakamurai]KXZ22420.1 hypothetical protein AXI58_10560 [Bacillus nakamurai]MED1228352.1 hypothetical protein [Bacillus nakamurai]